MSVVSNPNVTALITAKAVALSERKLFHREYITRIILTYTRPKLNKPQSNILSRRTIFSLTKIIIGKKEQTKSENTEYPNVPQLSEEYKIERRATTNRLGPRWNTS